MADLDTRAKRQKGIAVGKGRPLPEPDGSVDAEDRASVAKVYSGLTPSTSPGLIGGFKVYGEAGCMTFIKT